jgi:hypothetical protein
MYIKGEIINLLANFFYFIVKVIKKIKVIKK